MATDGIPGAPVLIASHERSGTHLTIDIIRRQFPAYRAPMRFYAHPHTAYLSIDRFMPGRTRSLEPEQARDELRRLGNAIVKTHALPDWSEMRPETVEFVRQLDNASRGIYIVRDPIKTFCSFWSWTFGWRGEATGTFQEFLREPRGDHPTRVHFWAEHVKAWRDRDGTLMVRFEDLVKEPRQVLRRIGEHIDASPEMNEPLMPRPVKGRLSKFLDRVTGRYESTNLWGARLTPRPHEVFGPEDLQLLIDAAGDVMDDLGYDTNPDWILPTPPLAGKSPTKINQNLR